MPLQGTFDVLDFTEVLEILALHAMTGRLHVRSRSFAANLFFADGQIVGADQSEHQAAAVAGDVTQRAREICFELLETDRGNFEFHPGKPSAALGDTVITVAEALQEARQRLTEWQEIQELIPSLDVQPRLVTELDPGQVTLDREQWRVLTAVDGRRNLRSIGRMLNMSDFEVCRAMRELLSAKVIEFDMRPAGMATISEFDIPATEQVTINGKRATRLRPERAHTKAGLSRSEVTTDSAQTILISPNKPRSEVKPLELSDEVSEPEDSEPEDSEPEDSEPQDRQPEDPKPEDREFAEGEHEDTQAEPGSAD
jgi:hypothetical protein